jgi:hypothetical protein
MPKPFGLAGSPSLSPLQAAATDFFHQAKLTTVQVAGHVFVSARKSPRAVVEDQL